MSLKQLKLGTGGLKMISDCLQCIHQFVCKKRNGNDIGNCDDFKNGTEVKKLHFLVGHQAYFINSYFGFLKKPIMERVKTIIITDRIVYKTENRAFTDKDINNTVFLARIEAENALKERAEND